MSFRKLKGNQQANNILKKFNVQLLRNNYLMRLFSGKKIKNLETSSRLILFVFSFGLLAQLEPFFLKKATIDLN